MLFIFKVHLLILNHYYKKFCLYYTEYHFLLCYRGSRTIVNDGLSSYWPIPLLTDDCWPESLYLCLAFLDGGLSHCFFPSSDFHRLESQLTREVTAEVSSEISPAMEKSKRQTGFIHMPGHFSSSNYIQQLYEKLCHQLTKLPLCWSFFSSITLVLASE